MKRKLGYERCRRHAWLRIDFKPNELALRRGSFVKTEVRPGNPTAADYVMSLDRQSLYFLLNIR